MILPFKPFYAQIERQVGELQSEEQGYLDTQQSALAALRPAIEADVRCLLSTRQFAAFVFARTSDQPQWRMRQRLPVNPDPMQWQLALQPLPLQIVSY